MSRHLLRLVILTLAIGLACPAFSHAQEPDSDKYEIFGGFSAYHVDVGDDPFGLGSWAYGAIAEFTWFPIDWFGIGGEVAYHQYSPGFPPNLFVGGSVGVSQSTFLAGMRFRYKNSSRFVPSGHVKMGLGHATASVNLRPLVPWIPPVDEDLGDNAFAVVLGGALDINVTDRIAIRAIQPDIVITTYEDASADLRISTGLLVRF